MAGASLLTLLDDIASVLDDVAILTKLATKKTAGVLGDDLALNAQQVTGVKAVADEQVDLVAFEQDKIKGAIRTDFILSAEIIVLSLGVVEAQPFTQQALVLVVIALGMTVGV